MRAVGDGGGGGGGGGPTSRTHRTSTSCADPRGGGAEEFAEPPGISRHT